MPDLTGQSLGRYHILEKLGEGGMATVYKAYDTRLETDVAVKVIRTENILPSALERTLKRFEREAKALARLTHTNIVKVTDYGEFEGMPYLVMEYLPGKTLKEKLGKPIPWQEAVQLLLPIARALDFAHRQNMIHRDVKPSNILITADGEPMLTDFGIAKILDLEETQDLTGTSAAIGTPEYMAPEQATAKTVDARADIYSLGIVLYEMVTGRKPFTADTPMAVLIKQAHDPLPKPRQFASGLPDAAEKVLLKALAKQPEYRYQSMDEFAAALNGLLAGKQAGKAAKESRSHAKETATLQVADPATQIESVIPAQRALWKAESKAGSNRAWLWGVGGVGLLILICAGLLIKSIPGALFSTKTPNLTHTESQTPEFTPTAKSLQNEITDSRGVSMRLVPAGKFTMGSSTGNADENPVHDVYLDAYYMDTYEVTNALYETCVSAGVCASPHEVNSVYHSSYYGNPQFDDYPVIKVDWNQAKSYCEWRGAQLPTEAQWEKAARGTDARTYPWGEGIDCSRANYIGCVGDTSKVGSYESGKSFYGLYDLAGNVWEWVSDWYDSNYYSNSPSSNPQGPASGQERTLRGGSWGRFNDLLRTSSRDSYDPVHWSHAVGFRCVRSASLVDLAGQTSTPVISIGQAPMFAVINAIEGGGAYVRKTPGGEFLATLDNGDVVELLGETQELRGVIWVKIAANKNGSRIEGWVIESVLKAATPTVTEVSTQAALPVEMNDSKGVSMRLVPAGKFTMGSDAGEADEKPVHGVYLDAYYMDTYEVTNSLYETCVSAGVCTSPYNVSSSTRISYYGTSQFDDFPMINVDWNQAKAFCEWRGAQLPTEAQWEKAARGMDGRTYPWGEQFYCDKLKCMGDTTKVGSYESGKSPYGIYDLAGNVWEWLADWYDRSYYANSPFSNPLGPSSGHYRVLRGGSVQNYVNIRSADRSFYIPDYSSDGVGFRCARPAQ